MEHDRDTDAVFRQVIRREMTTVLLLLFGAYCVVLVGMFVWQGKLVYLPTADHVANPGQVGLAFEDVWLTADDGVRTHAWYVGAPSTTTRTVLFFHGNDGNISHRLQTLELYYRLGVNVLIFDYRGYGRSDGVPSERGIELDAIAAWNHLREQRATPAAAILLHGRSLGAGIALALADHLRSAPQGAGAVFVESTFTSVPDLGVESYPWLPVRWLARIHYPNRERVARLRSPLLLAHSPADEMIPFRHGERLHAAAPAGTAFLRMDGGHNDAYLVTGHFYVEELSAFIDKHLP